jgi:hypothetical protein
MEQIVPEKLLQTINELTGEQRLFVDFPQKVVNQLELLQLQIKSAEALFTAYLNNTSELANEFNLSEFLTFYANLANKKDFLFKDTSLHCLGTAVFNYCDDKDNKTVYYLDYGLKKLVFRKLPEILTDN